MKFHFLLLPVHAPATSGTGCSVETAMLFDEAIMFPKQVD